MIKEYEYIDLDAKTIDALEMYELKFVYDKDIYLTPTVNHQTQINSMEPLKDQAYFMAHASIKQSTETFGDDVNWTQYWNAYYNNLTENRINKNTKLKSLRYVDIFDVVPLANYKKNDRIVKLLYSSIVNSVLPGEAFSFKKNIKRIVDILIEEEILLIKDFNENYYSTVRNRFLSLMVTGAIPYRTDQSSYSVSAVSPFAYIRGNLNYSVNFRLSVRESWQTPETIYSIVIVDELPLYNCKFPDDNDILIMTLLEPIELFFVAADNSTYIYKTKDHISQPVNTDNTPIYQINQYVKQKL